MKLVDFPYLYDTWYLNDPMQPYIATGTYLVSFYLFYAIKKAKLLYRLWMDSGVSLFRTTQDAFFRKLKVHNLS